MAVCCCRLLLTYIARARLRFIYAKEEWQQLPLTYVDEILVIPDEQVPQDTSFMEVAQADHVLDALHRRRVHRLYPSLWG